LLSGIFSEGNDFMTMHAHADRLKTKFLETADLFHAWQSGNREQGIPHSWFGACQDVLEIHDDLSAEYAEQLGGVVTYSQGGLWLYRRMKSEVGVPLEQ
jgi:hypothetical protein